MYATRKGTMVQHPRGHSSPGQSSGIGCAYLVKLTIGISLLMIANSWLVGKIVGANMPYVPDLFDDVRVYQFFMIFVPILMVCAQFWVYDRIRDSWIRRGGRHESQDRL
ncbi:MAG: hypothetical protein ACR2NP_20730 [Pirellulaceae bacterium]